MQKFLFTSESVSEGHPDKIADQISDTILDSVLQRDPEGRVACEAMVTTGLVFISGEITTQFHPDYQQITRALIKNIGYTDPTLGFDYASCGILVSIAEQSQDISQGVNTGGAGDQGIMFGYATNETKELMPYPILLAHKLTQKLSESRKSGEMPFLRPDSKAQVTIEYKDFQPKSIHTIVVSTQHTPDIDNKELHHEIIERIIKPTIPEDLDSSKMRIMINPTGRFVVGGPHGDCGLTGRKIIVDTYGGFGRHGGGAFSGKDPSKVDRSAAYMARHVSKSIIASGLAERCEVQLAYVIGVAEPVSLYVNTYGTGTITDLEIVSIIRKNFDLTPNGIIQALDLKKPIYLKTATYGHFGRDIFPWERANTKLSL